MVRILILSLIANTLMAQNELELAGQYQANGNVDKAISVLTSVQENASDFAEAQFNLGRIAFDKKDYEDAIDYFEEAVEENLGVADYHRWLAKTYAIIVEDVNVFRMAILAKKIKSEWEKTLELEPSAVDAHSRLIEWHIFAPAVFGGNIDEAIKLVNSLKKYNLEEGYHQMGNVYSNKEDYSKALEMYNQALPKLSGNYEMLYQMGKLSALSGEGLEDGAGHLLKYLEHEVELGLPSHAWARIRLAQIYEKQGENDQAKRHYEMALKEDKSIKEAKEGLSRVIK